MNLRNLHPTDITSSLDTGIQEFMRTLLIRVNFVPGLRHVIGWRGLKDSSLSVEGWTAKIKDYSGVFGIYFMKYEIDDGWINGRFGLNYFPDPTEELVELFSLQAGIYAQKDDYMSRVRNFLAYPELCELFNIGTIDLSVNQYEDAMVLSMQSISNQRIVAKEGISLSENGETVEIVAPGGFDQNFPSYQTALNFFHVLAASVTFNLEEPPNYLSYMSQPGKEVIYDSSGSHWETVSDELQQKYLLLGYGKKYCQKYIKAKLATEPRLSEKMVFWNRGDELPADFKEAQWWKAHQIGEYKTLDKKILGVDDRPQLIVLTGFLGSGKTSFLQHFIEYQVQRNRFVAIIQNEIGEIGLDGKLLDQDYAVTEIDEGCVCCSLVGNLKKAIQQVMSSFQPDYIVLETTGLANPYNLINEISEIEELVRFDSVTTIIDGLNIAKSIEEYAVASEQIKCADILLLNKKDLLTKIQRQEIMQTLKGINPTAPIISTAHGDVNPALLYGVGMQATHLPDHKKEAQTKREISHPSHQHDGLSSRKFSFSAPIDRTNFIKAVEAMPPEIFRIKGVINFAEDNKPMLFQYVGGRFEFSEFDNPKMTDRFLILIGQNIKSEMVESVLYNHLDPSIPVL